MTSQFYEGKRLSYSDQLCTVRYVGPIKILKGEWLGVEWDEPGRGKHSGQHEGVKYFECKSKDAKAASFIRPTRPSDAPRSFLDAVKEKYASEYHEGLIYSNGDEKKNQDVIKISGKEVEEVGFDKIRKQLANLQQLKIVLVDGLRVTEPLHQLVEDGSWNFEDRDNRLRNIHDTCPRISELDLSRNLFEDWFEVLLITEQLNSLTSLKVDGNRFRIVSLATESARSFHSSALRNISTLSLDDTLLPWTTVLRIGNACPRLTSLSASHNNFGRVTTILTDLSLSAPRSLRTVTTLTLEDNDFEALCDIGALITLPCLQNLHLKHNRISMIRRPDSSPIIPTFPTMLRKLDISYNSISTWSLIDFLPHMFPGLTDLRIAHNPLYQDLRAANGKPLAADDGYMLTIARLAKLKALNYSPITDKERLNAEAYYLSQIAAELSLTTVDKHSEVLKQHPRYEELCEEYGDPTIARHEPLIHPNALFNRLVKINFYLEETARLRAINDEPDMSETEKLKVQLAIPDVVVKEIPKSVNMYTVYGIAAKLYSLEPKMWARLRLVWETEDEEVASGKEAADDDDGAWDSDEEQVVRTEKNREVELVKGTRTLGSWVEGSEIKVRVELASMHPFRKDEVSKRA